MAKRLYSASGDWKVEAGVKDDIRKWLIAHRIYDTREMRYNARGFFWMPVQTGMGLSGVSDFLICFQGMTIALETKAENKPPKPSPHQALFIGNIKVAGGKGFTVNSLKMFVEYWVDAVDDKHFLHFPEEKSGKRDGQ